MCPPSKAFRKWNQSALKIHPDEVISLSANYFHQDINTLRSFQALPGAA